MFAVLLVLLVDEGVKLTELEFQCGACVTILDDLGEGTNNIEPVLHVTLVVVGHVQDQEISKVKFLVHIILRLLFRCDR